MVRKIFVPVKINIHTVYSMKYVYLVPRGGFNDICARASFTLEYCRKTNRTLLLDMKNTLYGINLSDYADHPDKDVICDMNEISKIVSNSSLHRPKRKMRQNTVMSCIFFEMLFGFL